ncbi:DNA glycosylase [Lactarius quietus]|nr:DNA glycosylase [Lactarius quietus]
MPATRSATRARAAASAARALPVVDAKRPPKLQDPIVTERSKKATKKATKVDAATEGVPRTLIPPSGEELAPLPAELTFSLEDAKNHLIRADYRFGDIFSRLPCKPFEGVEGIHPFRLVIRHLPIVGHAQQISWSAARSIKHKFLRLYFPELPEKPDEQYWASTRQEVFPTAYQVATTDLDTLRTAGLTGRKTEYVRDLATRFADGRLTNQKLLDANDEELFELLTAVYGIGRWTVEMFAIFSLRRPDILPVGDLGVQRGLLRWVLSLHDPEFRIGASPKKLPDATADPRKAEGSKTTPAKSKKRAKVTPTSADIDSDQEGESAADDLPTLNGRLRRVPTSPPKDVSSSLPTVTGTTTPGPLGIPSRPPPLTPSVTQVLSRAPDAPPPPPLPAGLTVDSLRSRLNGKNKVKGAIMTPKDMEELTESWRPYRSVGVYYMWRLAEEKVES